MAVKNGAKSARPHAEVGARIKALRDALGWTQEELGWLVGTSEQTVSNWESGRHLPRRSLAKLAATFGRTPNEILGKAPLRDFSTEEELALIALRQERLDARAALESKEPPPGD